jgi:Zn-dependent peptidase ImmA (M78 family)
MSYAKWIKRKWNVLGASPQVQVKKDGLEIDGAPAYGLYYIFENKIEIDGQLNHEQQLRTLCHELGHAIIYRVGLNQANISPEVHELLCENFGNFMYENFMKK